MCGLEYFSNITGSKKSFSQMFLTMDLIRIKLFGW